MEVAEYRRAVEAAAKGELVTSLRCLEKMSAVIECGLGEQRERLAAAYLGVAGGSLKKPVAHRRA